MPSGDRTESPAAPDAAPATESTAVQAAETESQPAVPVEAPAETPPAPAELPVEPPAEPPTEAPPPEAAKPPEPEKPKLHTDTPTLIQLAGKEGPTPEGTAQLPVEPAPAEPRSYEPFNAPEGLALDQTRMTEAASQLFAADNLSQERAQAYVDFHIAEMQRFQDAEFQARHNDFANVRADWVKQVMADPVLGGNNFNTVMRAIAEMRDLFVSAAEPTSEQYAREMAEFDRFLVVTGAGDHPAFNRLLHNIARKWAQPAAPTHTYKPPEDIGRRPNGAGSRRAALYGQTDTTPRG